MTKKELISGTQQRLKIMRGVATRSYENSFFRTFARNLADMFDKYALDGMLIAHSECSVKPELQIDILLITPHAVCIIDLKNFGGDIILPNNDHDFANGRWVNGDGFIKGGSRINPYLQLDWQKRAFSYVYYNSFLKNAIEALDDTFNPQYVKKIVCFQKPMQLQGTIPAKDEMSFFITDSDNYLETIKDILDVKDSNNSLSPSAFNEFSKIYQASPFDLKESYIKPVSTTDCKLDYDSLYLDQKEALEEISSFLQSDNDKVFILQGSSLSGKTHLLHYIEDLAFVHGFKQVEFFASSARVANNLLSASNMKFHSIYSYIYGGEHQQATTTNEEAMDNIEGGDKNDALEIIPLKPCEDEKKALFIVDDAQLVSDSYYQSFDLRFGSGHLLKDFMIFADVHNSDRKIIFIGDPFQLTLGKKEQSSLNPENFINNYNIEPSAVQLLDKPHQTPLIQQSLALVSALRNQSFNLLNLRENNKLQLVDKTKVLSLITGRLRARGDFHILTFRNEEAHQVNLWIKKNIIKNGEDIAPDDLILINNNVEVYDENSPFSQSKIYNGQFATVVKVEQPFDEIITPKGKQPVTLTLRAITVRLSETGHTVRLLSLENYRLSNKGELSDDEIIALKILLDQKVRSFISQNPFEQSDEYREFMSNNKTQEIQQEIGALERKLEQGEKVKTKLEEQERRYRKLERIAQRNYRKRVEKQLLKDRSSKYYTYKNCAYLRFGWAMTVHKSMSYKWKKVLFNVSQGEAGKSNASYFRWLYTGLTRATDRAVLINYKPISPFSKVDQFKDSNIGKSLNQFYIVVDSDIQLDENVLTEYIRKYNHTDKTHIDTLVFLYQRVNNKLQNTDLSIGSIKHANYQVIYELQSGDEKHATVSFYYNAKGQVKLPRVTRTTDDAFGVNVKQTLTSDSVIANFDFIADGWRKNVYQLLASRLQKEKYGFTQIIQQQYKDSVCIMRDGEILSCDMYYNADGFFTTIIVTSYSDVSSWEYLQQVINNFNEIQDDD